MAKSKTFEKTVNHGRQVGEKTKRRLIIGEYESTTPCLAVVVLHKLRTPALRQMAVRQVGRASAAVPSTAWQRS